MIQDISIEYLFNETFVNEMLYVFNQSSRHPENPHYLACNSFERRDLGMQIDIFSHIEKLVIVYLYTIERGTYFKYYSDNIYE